MANPQTEDGHVKIANELFDAIAAIRLPARERCLIDCIIRKTYGYNKKTDWISLSQFSKYCKVQPQHVCLILKELLRKNIIKKFNGEYLLNKDFETWLLPKTVLPKTVVKTTENGNLPLPKTVDTKDTITKDTITKDIPAKKKYGETGVVQLTDIEYRKLCQKYGGGLVDRYIRDMEDWCLKKKKNKYDDHYRGLLSWFAKARNEGKLKLDWSNFREEDFGSKQDYEAAINRCQ